MVDPSTIIAIAPFVLDFLFGEGETKNKKNFFPNNKKQNKMAFYGYGYKYPSLANQPKVAVKIGKRTYLVNQPTDQWWATYELNKKLAEKNSWIKFMKEKMPELKAEYYEK
ncbi:MAG: hypothetical protein NZZ41_07300, partial [Candidatus Dojkabacteria bacterium]|nr:hypothetical protein [Candidatus Dojkabacteria bacterium]